MKDLMKINQKNSKKELYAYEEIYGCLWFDHECMQIPYVGNMCLENTSEFHCNFCFCR